MFKKHSILDRKVRNPASAYKVNEETVEKQYTKEQDRIAHRRTQQAETDERIRRAYDPEDEELFQGFDKTYAQMKEQLAVIEDKRREQREYDLKVPEWDAGYRPYSAVPWNDRVNPWAGSAEYEQEMKRAYLTQVKQENFKLEEMRNEWKQYEKDLDRWEFNEAMNEGGVAGDYWNKHKGNAKWLKPRGNRAAAPKEDVKAYRHKMGHEGVLQWSVEQGMGAAGDYQRSTDRPLTAPPRRTPEPDSAYALPGPAPTRHGTGAYPWSHQSSVQPFASHDAVGVPAASPTAPAASPKKSYPWEWDAQPRA
ncbi:unnamed protein product [Pedinophyceae sp. YPF-701]|nr:unnamed protein product [Pedinophyceae sp. YPF-701]